MNKTKLRINKRLNKRYLKEVRFHYYLKDTLKELGIYLLS
jgi:hypothetical protein